MKSFPLIALIVLSPSVLAQRVSISPVDLAARIAVLEQQIAALQPNPQVAGHRYHVNTLFSHLYATGPHPVQGIMFAATEHEMGFYGDGTGLAEQTACTGTRLTDPEYIANGNPVPSAVAGDAGLCWPADLAFDYVQTGNTILITFESGVAVEMTVSDDGSHISHGLARTNIGSPGPNNQTLSSGHALIWTGVRLSD